MKTNYKQSQAAPHAKPIFTVSRNDSTLYVLPAYLAGAVMIRLQHVADEDMVKKLCCKDSAVLDCRAIRLPQPCRVQGTLAGLLRGHESTEPVSVDDTHEGLCTVRRVCATLSRTVQSRKPADTPPRRYNAGADTKCKQ